VLLGAASGQALAAGTNQVLMLSLRIRSPASKGRLDVAFGDIPVFREIGSVNAAVLPGDYVNAVVAVGTRQNILQLDLSEINTVGAKLTMGGTPGQSYQILVSTNLRDWKVLTTVTAAPTGLVEILDIDAKQNAVRFYRALAQ